MTRMLFPGESEVFEVGGTAVLDPICGDPGDEGDAAQEHGDGAATEEVSEGTDSGQAAPDEDGSTGGAAEAEEGSDPPPAEEQPAQEDPDQGNSDPAQAGDAAADDSASNEDVDEAEAA